VELLDGDEIRDRFPGTGFTREERRKHVLRVGFMAHLLEKHGVNVACSLISPYAADRTAVKSMCKNFVEVYVYCPLTVCENRDVKGLYARARRGEIPNFTGIDAPYEPPAVPDVLVDTSKYTVAECVATILERLRCSAHK